MARTRDPFANFERMRRADRRALRRRLGRGRPGLAAARRLPAARRRLLLRRRTPASGDQGRPRRRRHPSDVNIEMRGRTLVISGERHGARRRGPRLPADRDRERPVPARDPARRRRRRRAGARHVRGRRPARRDPARRARAGRGRSRSGLGRRRGRPDRVIEVVQGDPETVGEPGALPQAAGGAAGAAAEGDGRVPEHDDAAGGRPGALGQARQRRPLARPHAGDGREPRTPRSSSPAPTTSTASASPA